MSGMGEPTPGGNPPPPPPPNPQPTGGDDKKFSQDELTAVATREKDEGKRAGRAALLGKTGFSSEEELDAFLKKAKDAEAAQLSETERAKKEAEEAKREAEVAKQEAAKTVLLSTIKDELLEAGVPKEEVKYVSNMITVSKVEEVEEAVKTLKKNMPRLFEKQGEPPPPGSHPPPPPRGAPPTGQSPDERAKELLHKRHPHLKNKT